MEHIRHHTGVLLSYRGAIATEGSKALLFQNKHKLSALGPSMLRVNYAKIWRIE